MKFRLPFFGTEKNEKIGNAALAFMDAGFSVSKNKDGEFILDGYVEVVSTQRTLLHLPEVDIFKYAGVFWCESHLYDYCLEWKTDHPEISDGNYDYLASYVFSKDKDILPGIDFYNTLDARAEENEGLERFCELDIKKLCYYCSTKNEPVKMKQVKERLNAAKDQLDTLKDLMKLVLMEEENSISGESVQLISDLERKKNLIYETGTYLIHEGRKDAFHFLKDNEWINDDARYWIKWEEQQLAVFLFNGSATKAVKFFEGVPEEN